ncbi:protein of unknown function [Candidatus Filomicrobium marinum]|uniref:Uncharacterized protein n=1 Tax=Candidatus Filomicrobium marinum TaxID=1608628 RepID=A0A0D6JB09_9HYPH|nr:protein of unknown function [Candidatus Filomicrobium marinum]
MISSSLAMLRHVGHEPRRRREPARYGRNQAYRQLRLQSRTGEPCLETPFNLRRNEGTYVSTHRRDLPHEIGCDMPYSWGSSNEHGLNIRSHSPIHTRHLHFVIEVCPVSKTSKENCRPLGACRFNRQTVEGNDVDSRARLIGDDERFLTEHFDTFRRRKHWRLARMHANANNEPINKFRRACHHVRMAEGDGIEASGVKTYTGHSYLAVCADTSSLPVVTPVQQPLSSYRNLSIDEIMGIPNSGQGAAQDPN